MVARLIYQLCKLKLTGSMNRKCLRSTILFLFVMAISCKDEVVKRDDVSINQPEYLHRGIKRLNDVVIYEIFSPPVSSRIYSYASLAAYECIRWTDTSYPSLADRLNGFNKMPAPEQGKQYQFAVAGIKALFEITSRLTFTKDSSRITLDELLREMKSKGIDDETYNNSLAFGESVANAIWQRAGTDLFIK